MHYTDFVIVKWLLISLLFLQQDKLYTHYVIPTEYNITS